MANLPLQISLRQCELQNPIRVSDPDSDRPISAAVFNFDKQQIRPSLQPHLNLVLVNCQATVDMVAVNGFSIEPNLHPIVAADEQIGRHVLRRFNNCQGVSDHIGVRSELREQVENSIWSVGSLPFGCLQDFLQSFRSLRRIRFIKSLAVLVRERTGD